MLQSSVGVNERGSSNLIGQRPAFFVAVAEISGSFDQCPQLG
jgi:hypothetical protein